MVLLKIVVFCAAIVGALAIAQDQGWFVRAGFVGGCDVVATPVGEAGQYWSCREGAITGYPSLVRDSCSVVSTTKSRQYWRCPQPIERPSAV